MTLVHAVYAGGMKMMTNKSENKMKTEYKIYPRSKVVKLINDFIKEHKLDAEECPPYFEGLMYFRFVVEEDEVEEDE